MYANLKDYNDLFLLSGGKVYITYTTTTTTTTATTGTTTTATTADTATTNATTGTTRPVFTHGPLGPGPRAENFQGRHIKKIEIEVWYAGKKRLSTREKFKGDLY